MQPDLLLTRSKQEQRVTVQRLAERGGTLAAQYGRGQCSLTANGDSGRRHQNLLRFDGLQHPEGLS